MNNSLTTREREHLARVKELRCSVCGASGPSDAHHIRQGSQWLAVALCRPCHDALHGKGDKAMWRIHKMDEYDALAVTLSGLL
jgi:hypothetical protein